jgi:phenylacetate-coenzyme A ligase PaaK-like adenylate-forming protein
MPLSSPPIARTSEEAARLQAAIAQTAGVPFYEASDWQAAFADHSVQLADLPRITKSQLREHSPEGFLSAGLTVESLLARGLIEEESTSGTSGASVRVVFGKTWWAEQVLRRSDEPPPRGPHDAGLQRRQLL